MKMGITFSSLTIFITHFPSEKITISLKDNGKESKCYGLIHLTQQGKQAQPVCEANDQKIGAIVCRELDCGEFMFSTQISYPSPAGMTMSCPDHAESLWHCQRDKDNPRCQMKTIICSGNDTPSPILSLNALEFDYQVYSKFFLVVSCSLLFGALLE